MTIRIIDHKKIDLTDDEWKLYQEICKAYNRPNFQGASLFSGLFETNDQGIIQFVRPPSNTYTCMEVWLFIVAIFCHQHIREMYKSSEELHRQLREKLVIADEKLKQLDELIAKHQ